MTVATMMATATKRRQPHSSVVMFFFFQIVVTLVMLTTLDVGVEGYASWLKCFIEFDPDEIVMHQSIVPANESREKVTIEVQPYFVGTNDNDEDDGTETSQSVASPTSVEDEIAKDGTWISADEYSILQQQQQQQDDDKDTRRSSTTLKVRLRVPPSLQHEDVQWVVEAMAATDSGPDASPSSSSSSAQFIDVGVMCDGNRAFSRRHSEHVVLNIDHGDDDISLVAGWASGYEAVTLTPKMVLKRRASSSPSTTADGDNADVQDEL